MARLVPSLLTACSPASAGDAAMANNWNESDRKPSMSSNLGLFADSLQFLASGVQDRRTFVGVSMTEAPGANTKSGKSAGGSDRAG